MTSLPRTLRRTSHKTVLALCLLPFAVLCTCLALFGVDVLYWDEWTIWTGVLRDLQDGQLELATLVAQQNEQRNLAARAVGLALMPLCRLDRFCEYGAMALMAMGMFLILRRMWLRTRAELGLEEGRWLPLPMAALIFSTLQWQLFAFGVNTSITLTVLCLAAGLLLMRNGRLEAWRVALVVAVGWLGSFNFANALFYWICLVPLFFTGPATRRRRLAALGVFILAGVCAWLAYFHGYVKPPHHPPLGFALSRPLTFVGYCFTYLGAPLVCDENLQPLALLMGLGAFGLLSALVWRLWRQSRDMGAVLMPWLILAVFALMSDGATAVGRAGFGMHQALQSRYVTFANLFWIALLAVWAISAGRLRNSERLLRWTRRYMALALCVFLLGSTLSVIVFYNREAQLQRAREELFSLAHGEATLRIFPDPNYLRQVTPLFFERRLSVYREVGRLQDYKPAPLPAGVAGSVDVPEIVEPGGEMPSGVLLRGRAMDPASPARPAALVCFVAEGRIVFAAKPDAQGRFEAFLPADWFAASSVRIMPLAVSHDNQSAAFLETSGQGAVALPVPWYPPFVIDEYFYFPGIARHVPDPADAAPQRADTAG